MNDILKYWKKFTYFGVYSDMSYIEMKRVMMINLIATFCLVPTIGFSIINLFDQRYLLSAINISNTTCSVIVIILQHHRKHNSAKATLLISNFFFFFIGALLYKNGGEYFLLCIMIASMLLYNDRRLHLIFCIAVASSIAILNLLPVDIPAEQLVPKSRAIFNITNALVFIVIIVNFFLQIIYNNTDMIEKQRQRLQELNIDKEKIFSIIAHDIKSPFASLESLVLMLRQETINNNTSIEYIDQIYQQIVHQNQSLDDFLKWGSINLNGIKIYSTQISLYPLIMDIVKSFLDKMQTKKLKVNVKIPDQQYIFADKDHTIIIFRNLISNAIKFSYVSGTINIYSSVDEKYIRIHIQDEGIGINSLKSKLLFSVSQQKSIGTEDEPGAGLGLVLCKDLIERNKGIVEIESVLEKGSIFTVGLPKFTEI
ncbi:Sporulation kinase A [Sphingobacterium spiritivorum]|uniref:histidine kinase n=1 Tax=Sphingobacterium spiritivorum TaxID=258 RepID=A0A380CEP7_SPHSI|nr:HAMP domain-containing sensor histidine kinase [Sphingobacterium spiritivorum]SUJ19027.1 Sporulation kinase A [Sphingobacterium spiritivorum]